MEDIKNTVYIPLSRGWCVENVLSCLKGLDIDRNSTEVVILIDTDNEHFFHRVGKDYEEQALNYSFAKTRIAVSGLKPIPESAPIIARRQRIIELWEIARTHFGDTELFFSFEDDTRIRPDAFQLLLDTMNHLGADYVEGVEAHRQYLSIGAWKIERNYARTLKHQFFGTSEINGGGFYCFLTKTEKIKKANFREDGACFGPDVCFVYDLTKKGGKAYIDWRAECVHLLGRGKENELYPNEAQDVLQFEKVKGDWNLIA